MAVQKKFALGRGLDALISTEEVHTSGSSSISEIALEKISVNPNPVSYTHLTLPTICSV